jgi:hypothetical protein
MAELAHLIGAVEAHEFGGDGPRHAPEGRPAVARKQGQSAEKEGFLGQAEGYPE